MAITQNYAGKTIDLCVLETSAKPGLDSVLVGISQSGSVTSGSYKVVQKFIKYLMTELGSVPSDITYGTTFVTKLLGGQIHTSMGLSLEFYSALSDIKRYLDASDETPPPDENLLTVTLENFNVVLDSATMKLVFTFKDSSTIIAPVTISTV